MFEVKDGLKYFIHGKESYKKAVEQASSCKEFILDKDEDELVTSVQKNSCYNCLFRRWTSQSFTCMK
ncbi:molybdopterin biosynthesis protein MoeB [Arcobacter sp. YIC-464]|uniref:molybdopterin biosynthesis protein MoeB n=1 Tax=Arcobacter sp. YIC-464 TaxID=3376631 RepID=UPI003C216603